MAVHDMPYTRIPRRCQGVGGTSRQCLGILQHTVATQILEVGFSRCRHVLHHWSKGQARVALCSVVISRPWFARDAEFQVSDENMESRSHECRKCNPLRAKRSCFVRESVR